MSKYLDLSGLSTLWGKIKAKFATKDELSSAMSTKQNVLGINQSTGSANKFLNQQGSFVVVETDLSAYAKKTDIPTVNNSLITINQGGNKVASFSLNQSTGATINLSAGKVYSNATQTSDGLMSSADKKKLDGMGTGSFLTQEDADKRYMAKEHVVVTLTTTAGSVEGLKIHVQDSSGNEIAVQGDLTWKGTAIEFDISAGVAYKIVGDALSASRYAICRSETPIRVSSAGSTNNVTLAYNPQKLSVGVYIETLDGKAVTADNYSGGLYNDNPNVNSILVVTSSWTGRIALDVFYDIAYATRSPNKQVSGTMTSYEEGAFPDMDGAGNTAKIIKNLHDSIAANKAFNYTFRSGKHGYIPALGELKIIVDNAAEVNKCFLKLIGPPYVIDTEFWSSTQKNLGFFWTMRQNSYYREVYSSENMLVLSL